MKAILVRIGIDHSYGGWNAPADPDSGKFVYVPIPESRGTQFHPNCEHRYEEVIPALQRFADKHGQDLFRDMRCPRELLSRSMHLDPDFQHLTYGDRGDKRGSEIAKLEKEDLLVFYAGLRPTRKYHQKLIYALVGLYVVDSVVPIDAVPKYQWNQNAHTRKRRHGKMDIVVRAMPGVSGRFERFLPIGEYRDRAYRVCSDLLIEWGGLSVNDGYIHRSARPPRFTDPQRFRRWVDRQNVTLVADNNPRSEPSGVVVVHLRQPERSDPNETRADPYWEFGSFGCTGCHRRNVMNPRRIDELDGTRLAFAQGGQGGFKLVMLTTPVRIVRNADRCELRWEPADMPFTYESAPVLIDNNGRTDVPALRRFIQDVNRNTWMGKFSSRFRAMRRPLPTGIADSVVAAYESARQSASPLMIATTYDEALPHPPNIIDSNRRRSYEHMLKQSTKRHRNC